MNLKYILGLKKEIESLVHRYEVFTFKVYETEEQLTRTLKEQEALCEDALLIAATDRVISLGKQYGIATMAYANPDFPNQTYAGVDMIVEGFEEVDADFLEKVYQKNARCNYSFPPRRRRNSFSQRHLVEAATRLAQTGRICIR